MLQPRTYQRCIFRRRVLTVIFRCLINCLLCQVEHELVAWFTWYFCHSIVLFLFFFLLRFWAPEFWDFRRSCLAFCLAGWQCQSLRVPTISPYQLWPHVFCLLFCFSFHFSFFGNYIDHGEHTGTRVFVHQSWQIVVFSNRVLYR